MTCLTIRRSTPPLARAGLALLVLGVAGATARADDPPDAAAVRAAIEKQNAKYRDAVNDQSVDDLMALYTEDATTFRGKVTIKGQDKLRPLFEKEIKVFRDPTFRTTEVEFRGGLAYEIGRYTSKLRTSSATSGGHYLIVWKKVDGTWKIHVEMSVEDPPAK